MAKRNAIIMAAGTSSRFVPLSSECPKGLLEVKGEVLVERQIRQLKEAGINEIILVVGYKAELFSYLADKYGVEVVLNADYARFNNTSSLIRVIDKLDNTFVCSSDNYFPNNVFAEEFCYSYYSALFAEGQTREYCLTTNASDDIIDVSVGGYDSWYMVGHVYFNREFSQAFRQVMKEEYAYEETKYGYWEDVYIRYIQQLPKLKINRYKTNEIHEFDSLDELRQFDDSYIDDTRSMIVKQICGELGVEEKDVNGFENIKHPGDNLLFRFKARNKLYVYNSEIENKIESV